MKFTNNLHKLLLQLLNTGFHILYSRNQNVGRIQSFQGLDIRFNFFSRSMIQITDYNQVMQDGFILGILPLNHKKERYVIILFKKSRVGGLNTSSTHRSFTSKHGNDVVVYKHRALIAAEQIFIHICNMLSAGDNLCHRREMVLHRWIQSRWKRVEKERDRRRFSASS